MYTIKFDKDLLFQNIRKAADSILRVWSEDSVVRFVEAAKDELDSAFEQFILESYRYFSSPQDGVITDKNLLLRFTDVQNGYSRQMREWKRFNPLSTEELFQDKGPSLSIMERVSVKRVCFALGGGTLAIVILRLLFKSGWLWLLELPILYIAVQEGLKGHRNDTEKELAIKKAALVEHTLQCVAHWLDSAEKKNASLLLSFGIETL